MREDAARMARVFVTRNLPGSALDRLGAEHEVDVWPGRIPPSASTLRKRTAEAEGLLCLLTDRIDSELLDACPDLKAISNYAVGADNIDVAAVREREIPVGFTPDVLTEATADMAFALMLAVARRITEAEAAVREGEWVTWEPGAFLGRDVHGTTLGVVGYGRIGQAVARRATGFDMEVLHTAHGDDSNDDGTPLHELLERADFVSVHLPLTDDTRRLISGDELGCMKKTAYLVNTSRGAVIDPHALQRALSDGAIAGAALDVTDPEPLPRGHPLLDAPNLLVVPHIASATHGARERMAELAVDNLLAGLAGEPMPNAL